MEDDNSSSPQHDPKAPRDNAVQISRANRAAKRALKTQAQDGHRRKEIGSSDSDQDNRRRKICVCRPHHGNLAFAQLQVSVPPVDSECVHQHEYHGTREHNDQQPQT